MGSVVKEAGTQNIVLGRNWEPEDEEAGNGRETGVEPGEEGAEGGPAAGWGCGGPQGPEQCPEEAPPFPSVDSLSSCLPGDRASPEQLAAPCSWGPHTHFSSPCWPSAGPRGAGPALAPGEMSVCQGNVRSDTYLSSTCGLSTLHS